MSKKLITACMALVALAAFALPASASASPEVTHPTGMTMAVHPAGTTCTAEPKGCLLGTNIGNTLLKSGETILSECTTARLTGYLTKNNGTTIEGNITTATFTGTGGQDPAEAANMPECTGAILGNTTVTTNGTHEGVKIDNEDVTGGTPWCMKTIGSDVFTVRGGTCSEAERAMTFIMKSTAIGTCRYSRSTPIEGTYTTHSTGDAIFTLTSAGTLFSKEAGDPVLCPATGTLEMKFTMETDTSPASPVWIS